MKNNNIPKLRYPEFTDAWEKCKLGEVAGKTYGGGTPSTSIEHFWNGNIAWIQSSDLKLDEIFPVVAKKFISKPALEKSATKLIPSNSIAIVTRVGVGKLAVMSDSYATSQDFISLSNIKGDIFFIAYSLYLILKKESNQTQGTSIKGITKAELLTKMLFLPTLPEQQKIGTFFRRLDRLITLHKRKWEDVILLKKALLQKMFPKNGSDFPALRFPEFTDAWEKCKLGNVAEIVRGASPRPIQDPKWFDPNSEIGWLRISDVTEQNGRIHFLEQKISKLGQEKTRVLLTPHLLLSIAATVGKPVINYVKTGVHDGFLIFLNPKFDQEFMFQWLEGFRDNWQKYGQPGSQVNLNSDLVKSQEIHLPTLPEQQKIGTLFRRLDRLITLHKREWIKSPL